MSFASLTFFIFLSLVFALYWARRGRVWQNVVLLVASYGFYAWWDWRFCFLMLGSSLVDYGAGELLARLNARRSRRAVLVLGLTANLALLGFFKYFDFFVDSFLVAMAGIGIDLAGPGWRIILPVGISFYTFQTMSYTLDIYFERYQPRRDLVNYLAFVSFFPQLVAGPIERAARLLPQFEKPRSFDESEASEGCRIILWGLAKKLVLADNLAPIVNAAYADPTAASSAHLAVATVAFAFQIYCDFSAYSDIAIGVARLFGIRLSRNFATPYFSRSAAEFWRRWHISLSTWFRDYVYIPLGGNRGGRGRTLRNLFLTALISGLWHGAAWHFVLWGALHGGWLMAGRGGRPMGRAPEREDAYGMSDWARVTRTFAVVCLAWVLFRAEGIADALEIYARLAAGLIDPATWIELGGALWRSRLVVALVLGFVFVEWATRDKWTPLSNMRLPRPARWLVYSALVWLILSCGAQHQEEFIYFQF